MKLAFHGTSKSNGESILSQGFNNNKKNWDVPYGNSVFLIKDKPNIAFQKAFTQSGNPAYYEFPCKPTVIVVDIEGLTWIPDSTGTVPDSMNSIEVIDKIDKDRIVGAWSSAGDLSVFRPIMINIMNTSKNKLLSKQLDNKDLLDYEHPMLLFESIRQKNRKTLFPKLFTEVEALYKREDCKLSFEKEKWFI